ncbi:hypothetical protein HpMS158_13560 [Helicobacter pylori]
MMKILNHESGLKGIYGDNDARNIEARKEKGDKEAKLAFEMCAYRIKKYIGAYMVVKKSRCDPLYRGVRGKLLGFKRERV